MGTSGQDFEKVELGLGVEQPIEALQRLDSALDRTEQSEAAVSRATRDLNGVLATHQNQINGLSPIVERASLSETQFGVALAAVRNETTATTGLMHTYAASKAEVAAANKILATEEIATAAATEVQTMSFSQQKLIMREAAASMEALTGAHLGLRNIIRMALSPEMLALLVVMALVGKAIQLWRKHHEDLDKAIESSIKQSEALEQALRRSADAWAANTKEMSDAVDHARVYEKIKLHEELLKLADALNKQKEKLESAQNSWNVWNGLLTHLPGHIKTANAASEEQKKKIDELKNGVDLLSDAFKRLLGIEERGGVTEEQLISAHDRAARALAASSDQALRSYDANKKYDAGIYDLTITAKAYHWTVEQVRTAEANLKRERDEAIAGGAKHIAAEISQRKAMYDHLRELQAKAEPEALERTSAHLAAEETKDIAHAKKTIKNKAELFKFLQDLRAAYEAQEIEALNKETDKEHHADEAVKKSKMQLAGWLQGFQDQTTAITAKGSGDKLALVTAEVNRESDAAIKAAHEEIVRAKGDAITVAAIAKALEDRLNAIAAKGAHDRVVIHENEAKKEIQIEVKKRKQIEQGIGAIVTMVGQAEGKKVQWLQKGFAIFKQIENLRTAFAAYQEMTKLKNSAAGMKSGMTMTATANGAKATSDASVAATGSFSAMSSIPYVGPYLGMIMAALALAYGLKSAADSKSAASNFDASGGDASFDTGGGGGGDSVGGIAHGGLDMVPREGTYLLDQGEWVLNRQAGAKGEQLMNMMYAREMRGQGGQGHSINIQMSGPILAADSTVRKFGRDVGRIISRTSSTGSSRE